MPVATGGPPGRGEQRRVLIVKPDERWMVRFLDSWIGVYWHWVEAVRRRKPCSGSGCQYCNAGDPDWRAYAPAIAYKFLRRGTMDGQPVGDFAQQGAECALELRRETLNDVDGPLAGCEFAGLKVSIIGLRGSPPPPPRFEVLEHDGLILPKPFSVKPILCRFWGEPRAFEEAQGLKIRREA